MKINHVDVLRKLFLIIYIIPISIIFSLGSIIFIAMAYSGIGFLGGAFLFLIALLFGWKFIFLWRRIFFDKKKIKYIYIFIILLPEFSPLIIFYTDLQLNIIKVNYNSTDFILLTYYLIYFCAIFYSNFIIKEIKND